MVNEQAYYKNGYNKSISATHSWRTVQNSTPYLIPLLKPDLKVLDVGSGPGTITLDLTNYVTEGEITGVEPTQELIDEANANKAKLEETKGIKLDKVTFKKGSIYELPFPDNTFDLVHAHQVVIHLEDPISALKELRRVTKPNGYVGVKDADLASVTVYPPKYEQIVQLYFVKKAKAAGSTDIYAGRSLRSKALKAGYEADRITSSASSWCISDLSIKNRWKGLISDRLLNSNEKLVPDDEEANKEAIEKVIKIWTEFYEDDEAWLATNHGEIIYQKKA
ncbi:S-adenosyl-L-methionine-dependent methyltransferase [Scheffersomyces xylosifermentans]|uniref:S-adenosyl-L-methionine-dependent methyltransferase n=1 Tax=Scheffersomyces xylosifermentans TaxID=1304137 RepID=UPI00315CFF52